MRRYRYQGRTCYDTGMYGVFLALAVAMGICIAGLVHSLVTS